MNNTILGYIEECEAWKVAIKNLHWSADNLSQHELCDDIASSISDFEDLVSEVEQSISGKIKLNGFTPKSYEIKSLKTFVEDVISSSKAFLNKLEKMGENYVGIKSECETFIGDMQRKLYLVNFTMKEELKRRIAERINESYRKEENIKTTFHGTKPSTEKGMLKRINDITKGGQLNTRTFTGLSDAYEFYKKTFARAAVGDLHCLGTFESNVMVQLDASNNMTYFGLMRAKEVGEGQYKASITFSPHGDEVENPEPEISEPTIEDCDNYETIEDEEQMERPGNGPWKDFALVGDNPDVRRYERLDKDQNPKIATENKLYEIYGEGRIYRMTGNELHNLIKESINILIESKKKKASTSRRKTRANSTP